MPGRGSPPWHVLATLRNPPYLDFTWRSEPGRYHGFFWFYFLNEHVFRFLNMRHPRDYNTVPRLAFWLLHLLWLFPWSALFPAALRLGYKPVDRAGQARMLALCWTGFLLVFFSFSTTQEYYSMPCYPALALLAGSALDREGSAQRWGFRVVAALAGLAAVTCIALLVRVWSLPAPGDISRALTQNPEAYTLSLGHLGDLTIDSFAYLRAPLALAILAFGVGVVAVRLTPPNAVLAFALMMTTFFHAARIALVSFDPYLGSRALAEALLRSPPGELIIDNQYYAFSSIFFYANRRALLLNGRVNNLEYGSYAPGAPAVFIDDHDFARLWRARERYYVVAERPAVPRIERLAGPAGLRAVAESGGKLLYTNHPFGEVE